MARIVVKSTVLMSSVAGRPTFALDREPPPAWDCTAAPIQLNASVGLEGKPGERVAGWTLGFVQLYYLGSVFARYRGASVADGSALVARGHHLLCRDAVAPSHEIWYDPLFAGGTTGSMGTNRLPHGTVLRDSGQLLVEAQLWDRPQIPWVFVHRNKRTGKPNYLHYVNVEILFCTLLVAEAPGGHRQVLKHLYWNVIGEASFKRVGTAVALNRTIRLQQHVQLVHDGDPHDHRFSGREFDLRLPYANGVVNSPPRVVDATDWAQG